MEKATKDPNITCSRHKECYKCGGEGHFAVVCRTHSQKLVLMCETNNDANERQLETNLDKGMEEVLIEDSKLLICIIKRFLTRRRQESTDQDNWLQNNIFQIRVEYQGNALNLIIDNGRGMNVISQEIVDKLGLPVEA